MNKLTQDHANTFIEAVQSGIKSFERAGEILVEMLDQDPGAQEKLLALKPDLTPGWKVTFERIGRK